MCVCPNKSQTNSNIPFMGKHYSATWAYMYVPYTRHINEHRLVKTVLIKVIFFIHLLNCIDCSTTSFS